METEFEKRAERVKRAVGAVIVLKKAKRYIKKHHLVAKTAAVAGAGAFLIAPGRVKYSQVAPFAGRNFAHRGLHTEDKAIPENSVAAFAAAAEAGYGIELDVQLSRDGQVVVFHDKDLERVCGIKKRVDECDYVELSKTPLCGTAETVPLFTEVLELVAGRVPLIVELKTGKKNAQLCRKTLDILKSYNGDACIESFDPRIVAYFRLHAPHTLRGQLACRRREYVKDGQPRPTAFVMSRCMLNFLSRPQFIAYELARKPLTVRLSEKMGAMRVCWTSRREGNEKKNDAVIFEHYRPSVRF